MPTRVTFFFQQQSSKLGGWQENFWNLGSDPVNVEPKAQALASELNNVTGAQVVVTSFRIADAATFRNVKTVFTSYGGGTVGPSSDADYPSVALQIKLTANGGGSGNYKSLQWLRGIPDIIVSNSGRYNPSSGFLAKINAVFAILKNSGNGWAVNGLLKTQLPTPITGFANLTGFVTCPGHGMGGAGLIRKVRIKGAGIRNPLNGLFNVTIIDANTVQINFWSPETPSIPITGKNPTIRLQVYTQIQISAAETGIISSHKTGRPTNLLGGRRKLQPI